MEWWQVVLLVLLAMVLTAVALAVVAWVMWKRATREERRVIKRVGSLSMGAKLHLAGRLFADGRMPLVVRVALPLLVLYLALPIDFIPDFIPLIGWVDDVFVLVVGLNLVLRAIPRPLIDEHLQIAERADLDRTAIEAERATRTGRAHPRPPETLEPPRTPRDHPL